MKLVLNIILIFCSINLILGQKNNNGVTQESVRKGVIYKNEKCWDFSLHTNGYNIGYHSGKILTYYKTKYIHIDFGLVEHPRESKVSSLFIQNSSFFSNYTYGKQYSLWNLRASRGIIRYLSEKSRSKGLAVGYNFEGGLICGFLKPYYLRVLRSIDGKIVNEEIKYSEKNRQDFLDVNKIESSSSFWKGINETVLRPGFGIKMSLRLDPGAFEKYARSLELGFLIDGYLQPVQILVTEKKEHYFINFFAKLQFGKRY